MLLLLPPSEGKTAPRRGRTLDLDSLSFPGLTDTRRSVLEAVVAASAEPDALPALGVPLATALDPLAERGLVVDCRSSTYAAAWVPRPGTRWVAIQVPGATHMAKHIRGLAARHLCEAAVDARTPQRLADVLADRFAADLALPARTGRPWLLSVS